MLYIPDESKFNTTKLEFIQWSAVHDPW